MYTITRCQFNSYFDVPVLRTFLGRPTSMAEVHAVAVDDFNDIRIEAKRAFEAVYPDAHWPRPSIGSYVRPEVAQIAGGVMIITFGNDTTWYEVIQS